jgi:GNAT superfamily N-acetyltransferase
MTLRILDIDPEGHIARALLKDAAHEVRPLYPGAAAAPAPGNAPLAAREVYVAAFEAEVPLGCGALRALDEATAELARVYVRGDVRRRGIGRRLIAHLIGQAQRLGYRCVRVETGDRQAAAMALYQHCGFRRIAPFGEYAHDPTSVCYELELTSTPQRGA